MGFQPYETTPLDFSSNYHHLLQRGQRALLGEASLPVLEYELLRIAAALIEG